jgi:hypothetical protein
VRHSLAAAAAAAAEEEEEEEEERRRRSGRHAAAWPSRLKGSITFTNTFSVSTITLRKRCIFMSQTQ